MNGELVCGSLFSGVGGMDIGFAWAGWRHAFFAEIEPFGRAVLAERFPGVPIYSDVRDVPECGSGIPWGCTRAGDDLRGEVLHPRVGTGSLNDGRDASGQDGQRRRSATRGDGVRRLQPSDGGSGAHASGGAGRLDTQRLDVLTFGSPCQDLSVAGKRRGLDGDRSGLFWEAMRIAGDGPLRPRALLMENVEGLLSSNGGRDFALVLDAMAERGYRWSYRVLDSQHFGVAQRRRRVFVVAIADDDPRAERIGEVLALAEGGGGDSPTREPSWPDVAARIGAGAPSSSGDHGAMTHTHTHRIAPAVTAKWAKGSGGPAGDECQNLVTRAEWSGPSRPHMGSSRDRTSARVEPGSSTRGIDPRERERVVSALTQQTPARPDDKSAQAGHLVPTYYTGTTERGTLTACGASGGRTDKQGIVVNAVAVGGDVTHTLTGEGHDASEDGTGRGTPVIGFSHTQGLDPQAREGVTPTLRKNGGGQAASVGPAVRRLTPLECERLQGWPDGWTDIAWNGKPHAPDGKRYAAAGNGVTATVAYWIAARLAEVLK